MISVRNLSLRLGDFSLEDLSLTIGDREYFVILGPTGAGKTVLLECVSGLRRVRHGEIWLDGNEITHLMPEERNLGYVPQDYVLFPFLNVSENIAFGLKRTRHSRSEIQARVGAMAEQFGISHLLRRDTRSLSGGEKQRVALARALAPSPRILLLDEPLKGLDPQTSKYLRLELRRLHRELGVTTLHVTHNQSEAEELSDRIAVLSSGKVEQVGNPQQIFFYPQNRTVSDFIGAPNMLDCDSCRVLAQGVLEVSSRGMRIVLPHDGDSVNRLAILPRDIFVSNARLPGPDVNRFKGTITDIKSTGALVRLEIKVGENSLIAEMPHDIFDGMALGAGKDAYLMVNMRSLRVC